MGNRRSALICESPVCARCAHAFASGAASIQRDPLISLSLRASPLRSSLLSPPFFSSVCAVARIVTGLPSGSVPALCCARDTCSTLSVLAADAAAEQRSQRGASSWAALGNRAPSFAAAGSGGCASRGIQRSVDHSGPQDSVGGRQQRHDRQCVFCGRGERVCSGVSVWLESVV